ncbi:MAG: type II toxin-antitoxin system RelE/ParE family toxin [Nitrososphaeria archaeon]
MPDFKVLAHKRVLKFLQNIKDDALKNRIKEVIIELEDYPMALRKLDIEKLEGLERCYRIRVGEYRIIFVVDKKQRTIFITNIGKRESIYQK